MDQYLSTVIVAVITGIFSIITLIIQKRQDKVINKIDQQTMFIEKERKLKQDLARKEKERVETIYNVMMLILETNLVIIKMTDYPNNPNINQDVFDESEKLKKSFENISNELGELNKEYEMVIHLSSEFQRETERNQDNNSHH